MRKIIPSSLLILFLFLISAPAQAALVPLVPCGPGSETGKECQLCDLFVLFNKILKFTFSYIITPIVVIMAIVGGIFFFFAGASPDALRRAKGIILSVVIGVAIILSAWVIVNTIFDQLGVFETQGWQWWNIQCTYE